MQMGNLSKKHINGQQRSFHQKTGCGCGGSIGNKHPKGETTRQWWSWINGCLDWWSLGLPFWAQNRSGFLVDGIPFSVFVHQLLSFLVTLRFSASDQAVNQCHSAEWAAGKCWSHHVTETGRFHAEQVAWLNSHVVVGWHYPLPWPTFLGKMNTVARRGWGLQRSTPSRHPRNTNSLRLQGCIWSMDKAITLISERDEHQSFKTDMCCAVCWCQVVAKTTWQPWQFKRE